MINLKKDLLTGVFYTSLAKYSGILVQLVVTAILARLLTPSDYGIVAVATVFIAFFNILSDIGIGPAIIQFKDLTKKDLSNIFSVTAYLGVFMGGLFFLGSGIIAKYYGSPTLVPVCRLLSLTILFHCLNIVPLNLQYKNKRFKLTATVTLSVQISTAIVAIILAWLNFGVYALVVQQILSTTLIFTIYCLHEKLSFIIKIDFEPIKKILSFSIYQFLFNIINYFARNLDKLLVGRYIGLAPLGQYEKSYRTMMLPLQNITFVITPVMQPIFSEMQNNLQLMAEKYTKMFSLLCYIGFPMSILLSFSGKELVLLLFGEQWAEAVLPFRILALSVGFQILNGATGSIYQSANATKQLFISGCWCSFFMVTGFVVAIIGWHTIVAVSIGFVIAQLFNSAQTYYLLFKTLRYPLLNILKEMIYPLIVTAIIGGGLIVILPICERSALIVSLIVKCTVALVVWYILVNHFGPLKGIVSEHLKSVLNVVKSRLLTK